MVQLLVSCVPGGYRWTASNMHHAITGHDSIAGHDWTAEPKDRGPKLHQADVAYLCLGKVRHSMFAEV